MTMAAMDGHRRFMFDYLDSEAVAENRETLAERGAFDEPDECWCCGAALDVVDGRLVAHHARSCAEARAHLRLVA